MVHFPKFFSQFIFCINNLSPESLKEGNCVNLICYFNLENTANQTCLHSSKFLKNGLLFSDEKYSEHVNTTIRSFSYSLQWQICHFLVSHKLKHSTHLKIIFFVCELALTNNLIPSAFDFTQHATSPSISCLLMTPPYYHVCNHFVLQQSQAMNKICKVILFSLLPTHIISSVSMYGSKKMSLLSNCKFW